ncbi:MAG: GNAT family N-acetyltransferase [Anaerolineales bacterium]
MVISIVRERPDHPDARMLIEELSAYLHPLSPPESQHGYSVEKLLDKQVDFFVLRVDGQPAGCGGIEVFGNHYAEIKRMYVCPQFRGRGLGKRILDQLTTQARAHGVPALRLETGSMMLDAIALYENQGFLRIPPFGEYKDDPLSFFFEKNIK